MLSAELQFGGFDGARWGNLLSLFSPAETVGEDLLLVVDEQDVVLGALLRGAGRYPALLGQTLPPSLPTLCAQLGVRRLGVFGPAKKVHLMDGLAHHARC